MTFMTFLSKLFLIFISLFYLTLCSSDPFRIYPYGTVGDTNVSYSDGNNNVTVDTDSKLNSNDKKDVNFKTSIKKEPVICDESKDCYGECWGCAESHLCKNTLKDCLDNTKCSTLKDCVGKCDTLDGDKWYDCYSACGGDSKSEEDKLLNAFWDCIYCGACKIDCSGTNFEQKRCEVIYEKITNELSSEGKTWQKSVLSWYESYPDPYSEECLKYSGCKYSGEFVYFKGEKQTEAWVAGNNIIAVHSKHYNDYAGEILRIRQGSKTIDAKIYDMCKDDDCDGCCSRNMEGIGFLIDMEIYTFQRFGGETGIVEWICLTCN